MGVCSTMDITREDAVRVILDQLAAAPDEALCAVLYDLVGGEHSRGKWLNDFRIVSQYDREGRSLSFRSRAEYWGDDHPG